MKKAFEIYLAESYKVECNNHDLIQLNNLITSKIIKNEDRVIVNSLFCWIRDNIKYELVDVIGAVGTYRRGTGACIDKSSLLIALLRINKIPARYITMRAFLITKIPISEIYVDHCAVEAYINNNWTILDPTFDPIFDDVFPKAIYGSPNWWDLKKSSSFQTRVEITKFEMEITSKSYKKPSKWKNLISELIKIKRS